MSSSPKLSLAETAAEAGIELSDSEKRLSRMLELYGQRVARERRVSWFKVGGAIVTLLAGATSTGVYALTENARADGDDTKAMVEQTGKTVADDLATFKQAATDEHRGLREAMVEQQVLQVEAIDYLGAKIEAATDKRAPEPAKPEVLLKAEKKAEREKARRDLFGDTGL